MASAVRGWQVSRRNGGYWWYVNFIELFLETAEGGNFISFVGLAACNIALCATLLALGVERETCGEVALNISEAVVLY